MTFTFGGEKPVRKSGTKSRASKNQRTEQVARADRRALDRFAIVTAGLDLCERDPDLSYRGAWRQLKERYDKGQLDVLRFPAESTFLRWIQSAGKQEGAVELESFADGRRPGRPASAWHDDVVDRFEEMVLAQVYPSVARLHEDLAIWAESQEPPLPAPSQWAVRRRFEMIDLAMLSAARHGRKAARADAIAKLAVPSDFPHHVWTLDELMAANWCKAVHPVSLRLVSVRPWVILIADNYSRPIVSYHVCEPFKGGATTVSFDTEDVLGAFFAGVFPELASEACRPFVGYVPQDIRMDTAAAHAELKLRMRLAEGDADDMEPGSPWKRGMLERLVDRMKNLCHGTRAHASVVIPEDRVAELQEAVRTKAAATTDRVARKAVVAVEDLPTVQEYREILEGAVARYQRTKHRMLGMSPEVSYHNNLRKGMLRPAHDALRMLPPVTLTVGAGIEHRNVMFSAYLPSGRLTTGTQVVCRPDPLRRGMFVEHRDNIYFTRPAAEQARDESPGQFVREQRRVTAAYSEAAEAALNREVSRQSGGPEKGLKQLGDLTVPSKAEKALPAGSSQLEIPLADETPLAKVPESAPSPPVTEPAAEAASPQEAEPQPRAAAVPEEPPARQLPRGLVRSRNPNINLVR